MLDFEGGFGGVLSKDVKRGGVKKGVLLSHFPEIP